MVVVRGIGECRSGRLMRIVIRVVMVMVWLSVVMQEKEEEEREAVGVVRSVAVAAGESRLGRTR